MLATGEMEEIIRSKLGQDVELEEDRGNSSTGGSSESNSAPSSARNSPGSGSASGSASTITGQRSLKDHPPSVLASKKVGACACPYQNAIMFSCKVWSSWNWMSQNSGVKYIVLVHDVHFNRAT